MRDYEVEITYTLLIRANCIGAAARMVTQHRLIGASSSISHVGPHRLSKYTATVLGRNRAVGKLRHKDTKP